MRFLDWILLAAVVLVIVLAVLWVIRKKKKGIHVSCGSCSLCENSGSGCSACSFPASKKEHE